MIRAAIVGVVIGSFAVCLVTVCGCAGGATLENVDDGGGGGGTTGRGIIRGKVVDTSGQAVAGVTVTLLDPSSGNPSNVADPVVTDTAGQFSFLQVPYGSYKVRAGTGTHTITSGTVTLNVVTYNVTVGTLVLGESGPPEPPF